MKKTMALMALLIGSMAAVAPAAMAYDRDDCGYRGTGAYDSYTDGPRFHQEVRRDDRDGRDRARANDRRASDRYETVSRNTRNDRGR